VRKGPDWYRANDAEVRRVSVAEVLKAQAYVLVYEVEGMKEKHNFDCYSRYHRSLDEAEGANSDDDNGRGGAPASPAMWDFSALAGLLEACDAGLCGSLANVVDAAGDTKRGADNSLEEEDDENSDRRGGPHRPAASSRAKRCSSKDGSARSDAIKAYYKRGRSHTPSREHRGRENDRCVDLNASLHYRKRERAVALDTARDFDPPNGLRRAKSLSRVEKFKKMEKGGNGANSNGSAGATAEAPRSGGGVTRRRGPSRPRDRRAPAGSVAVVLPPLAESRGVSARRGMVL